MFKSKPKKRAKAKPAPKKTRGPRGEGSVFPDARRGGYRGKVPVGKYADGRTRYKEVWGATQAEAVEKKKLVAPPGPEVTVREWAARWVESLTVRASTRAGYVKQLDARLLPELGAERLVDLTRTRVKKALVVWSKAGVPTANRTLAVAATMFEAAILDGVVTARNPFADCPRLEYEPPDRAPFTPEELKALVENWREYTVGPLLALLAGTGARVGEAAALDVADYDPATGRVRITKTWNRQHGTGPPKSKQSRRTITVAEPARPAVLHAIGTRRSGPLFRTASGARYDAANVHGPLNALLELLGFPPRGPHAIRHGVASQLVARGAPLGDVAKHLGHTVAVLVRTYVKPVGTDPAEEIAKILA